MWPTSSPSLGAAHLYHVSVNHSGDASSAGVQRYKGAGADDNEVVHNHGGRADDNAQRNTDEVQHGAQLEQLPNHVCEGTCGRSRLENQQAPGSLPPLSAIDVLRELPPADADS